MSSWQDPPLTRREARERERRAAEANGQVSRRADAVGEDYGAEAGREFDRRIAAAGGGGRRGVMAAAGGGQD